MFWWDYKGLAIALHNNEVTEKHYRNYMLICAIFFGLSTVLSLVFSPAPMVTLITRALAVGFVLLLARNINRSGDNLHFWKRIFAFYLPATLRVLLLSFVVGVLIGVLLHGEEKNVITQRAQMVAAVMGYLYLTSIYYTGFKIASGKSQVTITRVK